ncbi:MAG TPA: hypothetical protein VHE13_00065 [Opitutus sp.]|nr:hypothetical protein [Opitutus sp.]
MPHHIALHASATAVGIIAFAVAATIFLAFAWRALRMNRRDVDRFAQLPFTDRPDSAPHV